MKASHLTKPEIMLMASTRGALGAGLGLLLSDRLSKGKRKGAGWALVAIGAATTVPLALRIFDKGH